MDRSTWIAFALLAGSLSLNAALVLRARSSASAGARGATPSAAAATTTDASSTARADACAAELSRCRDQSWEIARRMIAGEAPSPPPAAPPRLRDSAGGAKPSADSARRREALCGKAVEAMSAPWRRDREAIVAGLQRSLHDADEQRRNSERDAAKFVGALGLDGARADAFDREYAAMRSGRVESVVAALDRSPPDTGMVLDIARAMTADEDALALRYGGEKGRDAVRAADEDGRVVFLSILATIADRPIDDAIDW